MMSGFRCTGESLLVNCCCVVVSVGRTAGVNGWLVDSVLGTGEGIVDITVESNGDMEVIGTSLHSGKLLPRSTDDVESVSKRPSSSSLC